jgi:hypothetical protein
MENEQPLATGVPGAAETSLLVAAPAPGRDYFSVRFLIVYATLGAVLLASLVALVVFAVRPTIDPAPAWSSWRPPSGTVAVMAKHIADHIAPTYQHAGGGQLVAVVPSPPAVTAGTQNIAINAVALRSARTGTTDVTPVAPGKTEMYTLCGLGEHCAIASGKPSLIRGLLVRREALETALYTFKYIPKIESIIVFMPPPKGTQETTVLFFQREFLSERLKLRLNETLPLAKPPLPTVENTVEAGTIDALTLPNLYQSSLTQLQSGGALLVLSPLA